MIIYLCLRKGEKSPCRKLVPQTSVRVHLYAIQAIPRGLPRSQNFWTVSVTSCNPAITAEKLSRAVASILSGLYPYTISNHVSKFLRNAFAWEWLWHAPLQGGGFLPFVKGGKKGFSIQYLHNYGLTNTNWKNWTFMQKSAIGISVLYRPKTAVLKV